MSWSVSSVGHFLLCLSLVLSQPNPKSLVSSHVSTPMSWTVSLSQKKCLASTTAIFCYYLLRQKNHKLLTYTAVVALRKYFNHTFTGEIFSTLSNYSTHYQTTSALDVSFRSRQ